MDTTWSFRSSYETARKIKESQDEYCTKAQAGEWADLGAFPEDLQWEALVDVLRGRVKVHNHCYETVDLDDMVRLTNEFKFPIAAFHHAHETYLVPDALKKAYGVYEVVEDVSGVVDEANRTPAGCCAVCDQCEVQT